MHIFGFILEIIVKDCIKPINKLIKDFNLKKIFPDKCDDLIIFTFPLNFFEYFDPL